MLYFISLNFLCILFVLIALLFKNNQKELCHPVYDQVGCKGFWQSQRVWYFHGLTRRQVDKFGILVTPYGGPTPSHKCALRDGGSGVDHSLAVTNDDPKPPLLGLTSP